MRTVSWEEFNLSSERFLDEVMRLREPLFVRRAGRIVLEIAVPSEVSRMEEAPAAPVDSLEEWRSSVLLESDPI